MSSAGAVTTIMTSASPVPVTFVPPRPPFDGLFPPDVLDYLPPPAADRGRKRARGAGTSDDDDLARQLQEVAAADRSDASGEEECAICLCRFHAAETLRAMPACAHVFHHHCISEWLRRNPVCPLCRRRLPATNPTPEDEEDEEEDDWVRAGDWELEGDGELFFDERWLQRRRIRVL